MKKELTKKQKISIAISILIVLAFLITGILFKSLHKDEKINYKNAVSGLRDWTVEVGTKEVDYLSGVSWNKDEIKKVTVDSKAVDLTKEGNYDLTYTIDVIKKDVKDIKVEKKVKVVSKEEAKKEAEKGNEVATDEGIKNEKSEEDLKKADESKQKETSNNSSKQSNGSTAKSDDGKKNSSNSGNKTSNNNGSSNNAGSQPAQPEKEKPAQPVHQHKWEPNVIQAAWTEEVPQQVSEMHTFCDCGVDLTEFERNGGDVSEHVKAHALKHESTRTYEAPVWTEGEPLRIDHPAVIDGWKCSECGEVKK